MKLVAENEAAQRRLIMRGFIAELPPEDRLTVEMCASAIREIVAKHKMAGEDALWLVAAELDSREA